ncbi:AMP-binding protein [Micromonospora sp. WMMD710]|uniref:non-ribosomal peptide synthetase n=1 Tax=Micromonospora sp. WMMD710 TaxID=3016085 RepID=UPI002415FB52|nr:AMP-binding protein [Micromonospora sp. WMMD710]MDG4758546.1 AMP-binding protein [Micromonospora sp. WMMD710]
MSRDTALAGTSETGADLVGTSWTQDGVWLLERLAPYRGVHRIVRSWQIDGPVDVPALRIAWRAVLDRHEVLRTRLAEVDGRPVPVVAVDPERAFVHVDLTHLADVGNERAADRVCAAAAAALEHATDGPLARLTLVRTGAAAYRLVLALHRAVADDRSVSILVDELSVCYAAVVRPAVAGPAALPPAPRYADYIRWQRDLVAGPAGRQLLDWWTDALTPAPPPVPLPVDHDPGTRPSAAAGVHPFDWGTGLAGRLAAFCRARRTSPTVVLLAALQAVLHRYGDDDRISVVLPVPVLPPGFTGLVGPCDNLVVLCTDLGGAPTFTEAVGRAAAVVRAATAHRDLPFARLVGELPVERDRGRVPFCDVVLAVPGPEADLRLAGAGTHLADVLDGGPTVADLVVTVRRTWPTVSGTLTYRGDRFEAVSAVGVLGQVRTLLSAALAAPDTRVDRLPLDEPAALDPVPQTRDAEPPPVYESVTRHAGRMPQAIAVAGGNDRWTYDELERRSAALAAYLSTLPVDGAPVAVRMEPGPWQLAASLGVLRAGGHLVWFGAGDAGERGRAVLAELRPACLLRVGEDPADELTRWFRDDLDGRVIDVTAPGPAPGGASVPAVHDPGSRTAYIAYTSGSTGRPKGIAQTHRALAQFVGWMAETLELAPGARVAQWVTPEHDPSICEVFATLVGGGTLHPVPDRIRVHPEKLADWLVRERITFLQTVPSFARELLAVIAAREPADRPTGLSRLVLMGEALSGPLVDGFRRALPDTRLANIYGPTETIAATWHDITGPVPGTVPIGRPIPGRQVLVLDEAGRPCPTGVTGEIVVRSRHVCDGYVGGGGTGSAFQAPAGHPDDGTGLRWYHTGDLARRRWDGLLEFRGRRDQQVKLLGTRVELTDVEAALVAHDGVAECVVVPVTDRDGLVVRLAAYVVPRRGPDGGPLSGAGEWRTHLRRRFGTAMVLVSFESMPGRLPRTAAGKVDRRRLPALRSASARRAPTGPVEQALAEVWSALLGGGPVDAESTFFAAGGHSLLVPPLVARIRRRFGVTVTLRDCFTHHTLAGMAALIEATRTAHDRSIPADSADLRAVTDAME